VGVETHDGPGEFFVRLAQFGCEFVVAVIEPIFDDRQRLLQFAE